jgi:hypothetical protein
MIRMVPKPMYMNFLYAQPATDAPGGVTDSSRIPWAIHRFGCASQGLERRRRHGDIPRTSGHATTAGGTGPGEERPKMVSGAEP